MQLLPKWSLTNPFPSLYDTESGTAVQMVAKVYGAMNELIAEYNKMVDEVNKQIIEHQNSTDKDIDCFKKGVTETIETYIKSIDIKMSEQDSIIKDAVNYMKTNLIETIKHLNDTGDLNSLIQYSVDNMAQKFNVLNSRMNTFVSLQEGSTTGDAELMDARIGHDGTVHETVGEAIRNQVNNTRKNIDECFENIYVTNLLDIKTRQIQRLLTGSGGELTISGVYNTTDYIPVVTGESIYFYINDPSTTTINQMCVAYEIYDENKTFLSGVSGFVNIITNGVDSVINIINENAKYIRLSYHTNIESSLCFYKQPYKAYLNKALGESGVYKSGLSKDVTVHYESLDGASKEKIEKPKNLPVQTTKKRPLIVDTSSYFWMRKQSNLHVDSTYNTPDKFTIIANGDSNEITITGGTGIERLDSSNVLWAGVIKYDDGVCKPCIVTGINTTTNVISIYPKTEKQINSGEFTALLSNSQHLTELGYKAYMQYIYSVDPKYCDKNIVYDRYAPTSTAEMQTQPYTILTGSPYIYNGSLNDCPYWSTSQSVYGTFMRASSNYENGEFGFMRTINLDGREGYYETYIGTMFISGVTDPSKFTKDEGHELHIEWYVDDVLIENVLKTTNFVERYCFDIPFGSKSCKIKVYYTDMRKDIDTISIGDSTVWIKSADYGSRLLPEFATAVQMFDSWGAFWFDGEFIEENGNTYQQGASGKEMENLLLNDMGIKPVYYNRSIGGMTSRYGKHWFYKTVLEKHPSYVLLNYGINDYHHSVTDAKSIGNWFNFNDPYGNEIVMNDLNNLITAEEFGENMKSIFKMATTNGITPIYVSGVIAQYSTWVTKFINSLCE